MQFLKQVRKQEQKKVKKSRGDTYKPHAQPKKKMKNEMK